VFRTQCGKARNLKLLLYMFEQLSRLKINFDKSEILLYMFEQLSRLKINFDKSEILLVGGGGVIILL
jgi:hypothetical protein